MFTFSEMLALVESESSFGAYVCHRRPEGFTATSDLVSGFGQFPFKIMVFSAVVLWKKKWSAPYITW